MDFDGAKLALFIGDDLLVLRRDDIPTIPWPNYLDLPGGAREGNETPQECALRETQEEVGLRLSPAALVWARRYERSWFFAAHLPGSARADIVFGNEGQGWCMMPPEKFATHPEAVPHFREWVQHYLNHKS